MKQPAILLLLTLFVTTGFFKSEAQVVGKMFPDMPTLTLEEEDFNLPAESKGKFTLMGLAFSRKSEDELLTWFQPVYEKFIGTRGTMTQLFSDFSYDVNVYFIPMFTGIKTPATKPAMKQALKKIDPLLHPHILFYKGKLKPYKDALDFEKKDIPYFFVLDQNGKIVYATSGTFTSQKMEKIEGVIE